MWVVYPAGMGFGDVRLAFVLGLFLGWLSLGHVLVGIFCGFLLGAVIGVVLVVFRIRSRKDAIPFGPFLAAGAAVTVLVGDPMVQVVARLTPPALPGHVARYAVGWKFRSPDRDCTRR